VSQKNNIIEINGKRYDARTGKSLDGGPAQHVKTPSVVPAAPAKKPVIRRQARSTGPHAKSHAPSASKTLMRHAVKKPDAQRHVKVQAPIDALVKHSDVAIVGSKSIQRLDGERLRRARRTKQSRLVSRFSANQPTAAVTAQVLSASKPAGAPLSSDVIQPHTPHQQAATHHSKQTTTSALLEHALLQADSHKQPPVKSAKAGRAKRRAAIGGTAALAVMLIVVIATQNMAGAKLQVASAQAGFSATLPGYQPPGFGQIKLKSAPGVVTVNYKSRSDNRVYSITQKTSPWNSLALRDSYVAANDHHYETVATAGRTVYLFGEANATWVNNGIWYLIQTNGSLSNQQLVKLAASF
jgi:hypothetical protein